MIILSGIMYKVLWVIFVFSMPHMLPVETFESLCADTETKAELRVEEGIVAMDEKRFKGYDVMCIVKIPKQI